MKILVNDIFKILIENKIDNKTITEIHTQLLGHKKEFDNDINKNDLISIIHLFESTFSSIQNPLSSGINPLGHSVTQFPLYI